MTTCFVSGVLRHWTPYRSQKLCKSLDSSARRTRFMGLKTEEKPRVERGPLRRMDMFFFLVCAFFELELGAEEKGGRLYLNLVLRAVLEYEMEREDEHIGEGTME